MTGAQPVKVPHRLKIPFTENGSPGPSGVIAVKQAHAPRIPTLAGKRVGFVSNEQCEAYRMLPRLKALLEADLPGVEVLPIDAFP